MTGINFFREMDSLTRELDHFFSDCAFPRLRQPCVGISGAAHPAVAINLRADQDNYYVEALLPGIDPQKLEMTLHKDTLSLSGTRPEREAGEGSWLRRERSSGKFSRSIHLPGAVAVEEARADYRDGLLTITLPKSMADRPRRIALSAQ